MDKVVLVHTTLMAGTALLSWSAADAQSQPAPAAAEASKPTDTTQDIVVTAQRRSEVLQNVPISITAASAQTLERKGITRLEDIQQIAPGVQISRTGIFTQPAIRGVTTAQSSSPENNVAVYVDGFYQPSSRGLNFSLANISQIEVLKGPQGTLFGRNATGGAILVETLQPSLDTTIARVSAGYGNYDDRRAEIYLSTPLNDDIAFNVAGAYQKSDGYIKDVSGFDTAPLENDSVRAKLLVQPTDALSITATYSWSKVADPRSLSTTSEGHALAKVLAPASYVETRDNRTSLTHPTINRAVQNSGSLKAAYDFGAATLTSYTYYQNEKDHSHFEGNDDSALSIYDQYFDERYKSFSQEVNITSAKGSRLQYVVGAYYFHSNVGHFNDFSEFSQSGVAGPYILQQAGFVKTNALAGYVDATYQLADTLFLTGGLRYSDERKNFDVYAPRTGAYVGRFKDHSSAFTPRAVIRYEFSPNSNVYASFSKGFKSGLLNSAAPYNRVAPERITAYEVGLKTAQGAFRFDTSAFYYDYKNLQVSSATVINNVATTFLTNAANAHIYGAEAQLSARVAQPLTLSGGLAYTHARYVSFPNAPVSVLNPVSGLNTATCAGTLCTQDFSGRRMLRAPDWSLNGGAEYTVPIGNGKVVLSGTASYQTFSVPTKSDIGINGSGYRYGSPGYALLNLRAAWSPSSHWTISVFGQNVTNTRYLIVHSGTSFGDYHVYGTPATYGGRVEFSF